MRTDYAIKAILNIAVLSIFYTTIGGILSYIMYYLFDEFDETWEKKSIWYKFYDIIVELSLVGSVAFGLTYYMELTPPIFKISKKLDTLMDDYISGLFFAFAMFIFLDDLSQKIKYIFSSNLSEYFDKYLPDKGSILDLSLHYSSRKTDSDKSVVN
jgi:hypothetical protein